jgi:hypothetical protein
MIDTDKYEGHTEGHKNGSWDLYEMYGSDDKLQLEIRPLHDKWGITIPISWVGGKDAQLIADAPLLLAEVKRMNRFANCAMNFMSKHDLHFQFLNEHGVYTAPDGGSISTFIPYSYKWDDETKVSSESIQFTVRGEEE